jgi:L-ribulose-5-phosphate 4-epimerase
VPVTRQLTADESAADYEAETGEVIAEAVDDPLEVPAVLVHSHGPFTWGADASHAVENAIALEAVAAMALDSLRIEPGLGPVQDELLERHFRRKHGPAAYYGQES